MAGTNLSFVAAATISIAAAAALPRRRFVGFDGNLCGAAAPSAGVTIEATDSGDQAALTTAGTAVVEAGAAITLGAMVKSDASGKAISVSAAASGAALPVGLLGYAMDAATADGEFIRIKLV